MLWRRGLAKIRAVYVRTSSTLRKQHTTYYLVAFHWYEIQSVLDKIRARAFCLTENLDRVSYWNDMQYSNPGTNKTHYDVILRII